MSRTADDLVDKYLKHLRVELDGLPRARRRELEQEIAEHIAEARAELPSQSEAEIRTLLDRIGDPADIAAEARARFGVEPRRGRGLEVATLALLLVGGVVVPVVGWLVGVVLLWASDVWTTREKLIGTLVVPGGLALPLFLLATATYSESCSAVVGGPVTCTGGPSQAMQVIGSIVVTALFLAPLVTTAYLARRMRRSSVSAAV
jgi:uncharacterized membrane protein